MGFPARRLGLNRKGTLREGADADLVLFNPVLLRDRATYAEPTLPPGGIAAVYVAGQPAVENRRIINGRLAKAIRK